MYTGFATQLWSYGGRDFADGRCAIASPASVQATEDFLAALRDAGPTEWPDQRWYELAMDFGRGRYGLIVDSDHYVAFFEDPAMSALVGRIEYALPPIGQAGSGGRNLTDLVGVVMNSRAQDRDAAWRFIQIGDGRRVPAPLDVRGQQTRPGGASGTTTGFALTCSWGSFHDVAQTLLEHEAAVSVTRLRTTSRSRRAGWRRCSTPSPVVRRSRALAAAAADIDALV